MPEKHNDDLTKSIFNLIEKISIGNAEAAKRLFHGLKNAEKDAVFDAVIDGRLEYEMPMYLRDSGEYHPKSHKYVDDTAILIRNSIEAALNGDLIRLGKIAKTQTEKVAALPEEARKLFSNTDKEVRDFLGALVKQTKKSLS